MSASAIEAGRAFLRLLVDDKEFRDGLDEGLRQLDNFGKKAIKIGAALGGAGAAITAPFIASLKVFSDVGSALNDMSDRTGVSVERLSALKYAAQQTGTDLATVEGALRKMANTIADARNGSDTAVAALKRIGISVQEIIGLSPEEQFQKIASAIKLIQDPTQKVAATMDIFGKSGTLLIPMIDDLDNLTEAARKAGLIMSTQAAKDADAFGDAMDTLKAQFVAVAAAIGAEVAPALTDLAEKLAGPLGSLIDFIRSHHDMAVTAGLAGSALIALSAVITTVGTVAEATTYTVQALNVALSLLGKHPYLIAISLALIAITALLGPTIAKWLGLSDANEAAAASSAKNAAAQNDLSDSMKSGTKEVDARTEALKRLHDEEDKRRKEQAIVAETRRQEEREAFLNQRLLPGERGRSLEAAAIRRQIAAAQERLGELQDSASGSKLIDIDTQAEIETLRSRIRQLEGLLARLQNPVNGGSSSLLASEQGAFPSLFQPGFNFALTTSLRTAFAEFGRAESRGLKGFDTPAQNALDSFEKQTRPILGTFNGRLAGQIFGGAANDPTTRIAQGVEKLVAINSKQRDKLEDIDRNLRIDRFRNDLA